MRRITALTTAALLLVSLTSCSAQGSSSECVASGGASDLVEATGDFGEQPEVSFPTPLKTRSVEKSVLIDGDTEPLRNGQPVILEATILSGDDGSIVQQTAYSSEGGSLFTVGDTQLPALGDALECAELGSRVAVVASAEATGAAGQGAPDSVVYVIDVLDAYASRADGAAQVPVAGIPAVVTAPDGRPGVTIPNEPAPTDYRAELTREGDGARIGDDDAVVVKLTAFDWENNDVAASPASTWETGSATILFLGRDRELLGEGLVQAIAGQTVGSQVVAVVPPGLAGSDGASPSAAGTLVYVIDILGTVDA